jgi:hypothetical protein
VVSIRQPLCDEVICYRHPTPKGGFRIWWFVRRCQVSNVVDEKRLVPNDPLPPVILLVVVDQIPHRPHSLHEHGSQSLTLDARVVNSHDVACA